MTSGTVTGPAESRGAPAREVRRLAGGRPLRIVLASETEVIGGAEMMLLHLTRTLQARGHEVHFVSPLHKRDWLGERLRELGTATHSVEFRRALDPAAVRQLRTIVRRVDADVVHSHMFGMAVYGTAATRLTRVPHVISMHGTGHETAERRRRIALRWAFRQSDVVIAVSRGLREELRGLLGRSAADRMRILYNGVPDVRGDGTAIRRELALAPHELLVVAVGNLFHNKAHLNLLKALAQLPPELPWRVAIAGREEEATDDLRAFIAAQGWERRAHLLGSRRDVTDLLAAADVYAMPSLREALPMSLLEAMMSGTPVIASQVGGIPEVVTDGVDGLLVPPGDVSALAAAVRRLLGDRDLRASVGAAGRTRALADFSLQAMTEAHEAVYDEVARRGAGRPSTAPGSR
ncbi:glycosyl transferase group 1 [Gemmatirosa kalamazoonensis]|uniref:Glycosyl transferase group 1 n=1 Tax=Gemmatirosa kalamazoonensis TaxID=861299 RepID=W0RGX0_9BACT|nr:glycosyltransferase family 4 protein [Gemmatirosa kalamazoonensis]AHG90026.1 glycosyl transferase group 1 [Gemmatirosa kalamazoonensis]